ncbi:MAG: phosphoglycerate dehydrogenase [Balneolaceae bacterium]|nr:phosphoglycerate dehydrogenase [Balneolaceae bacterium]MDR9409714.1 phosphoglycerate dehydrogenase [Balneolaceae bacterium]
MIVQITTSTFGKAGTKPIEFLKSKNIDFRLNPFGRKLSEEEAIDVIKGAEGLIAGTEPLTENVLNQLPDLKVISRCGTGMNNVDLEAAKKHGIKVFNTPTIHVDGVAELALTGTLASLRKLIKNDKTVRTGEWSKSMGSSLYDKNVGIIGFGKVGQKFCKLIKPFTSNIFYYDPFIEPSDINSSIADPTSLKEIFDISDVISLHIPYSEENHHLIDKKLFAHAKANLTLVNTSRGGLVNEEDLYDFLNEYNDAAAYLDVFEKEPYHGKLSELENVTMSPHMGTSTIETREEMELEAAENLVEAFGL